MFLVTFLTLHYYYDFIPYPQNACMHMCVHPPTHTHLPVKGSDGRWGRHWGTKYFLLFFLWGVELKQQKFIFLQFWTLEVQDQGQGWFLLRPLFLAGR